MDSAIAIELVRSDPHMLIWSPSQRATVPYDHQFFGTDWASAYFEAKAVEDASPPTVPIDIAQLQGYLRVGLRPLFYLLPVAPTKLSTPHLTICKVAGCCSLPGSTVKQNTQCICCPRDARSWTWLEGHYQSCPTPLTSQPWFSHWCWAVSASDLGAHPVIASGLRSGRATVDLEATDKRLGSIHGAIRMCHLLGRFNWRRYFSVDFASPDALAEISEQRVDHLHLAMRPYDIGRTPAVDLA